MRLFFTASAIFLKRSLLAVVCAALCLFLVVPAASLAANRQEKAQPVKLAIVNEDKASFILPVITSLVESKLEGMLTAELYPSQQAAVGCAAVLTLPEGFFDGIMTGENIPPRLTVNVSSPIEGAWVSCLARSAGRLITSAQGVVGAAHSAMLADDLPDEQRERSVLLLNSSLLNDYLSRKGRFESVPLSATGGVSLSQYYLASGASFMLLLTVFLIFEPVRELKSFSDFSRRKGCCFAAAFISCLLLSYCLTFAALLLMGGGPAAVFSVGCLLFSLLLSSVMMLLPLASPDASGCAALSAGFCLLQAVLGGSLIPEALLPEALFKLCGFWPLSLLRRLLADTAFGCGFADSIAVLLWCAALLVCCAIIWFRGRAAE